MQHSRRAKSRPMTPDHHAIRHSCAKRHRLLLAATNALLLPPPKHLVKSFNNSFSNPRESTVRQPQ